MTTEVGLENLDDFAQQFWKKVLYAKVFAFHGQMGAGKTTIITALCKAKGVADVIGSPTFSIINEYRFIGNRTENSIYHIDLYRLKNVEEVVATGVEDCLYSGAICMVEWPEKAAQLFDAETIHVVIQTVSEQKRKVQILSAAEFNAHRLTEQL